MYVKVERVEGRVISQHLHPSRPWILLGLREPTLTPRICLPVFSFCKVVSVDSDPKSQNGPLNTENKIEGKNFKFFAANLIFLEGWRFLMETENLEDIIKAFY